MSTYNPYADCPCGSGKKVKFCCAEIADEIVRISRLLENHQIDQVRQALDVLHKKPLKNAWSRAWVKSMLSVVLPGEDPRRGSLIDEALADVPEHPRANYLKALFALRSEHYPASRDAIENAFAHVNPTSQRGMAQLADLLAEMFVLQRKWLAASKYFHLAFTLDPTQERAMEAGEFLRSEAPFPVRSQILLRIPPAPTLPRDFEQASRLAILGAEFRAGKLFEDLARKKNDDADAWFNAGLCYGQCGESADAVRCFRESVRLEPDFERAVDAEVLAQILDWEQQPKALNTVREWEITGVSELLTRLDAIPRWIRADSDETGATYLILDRDSPDAPTLETSARVIAHVEIVDADEEAKSTARLALRLDTGSDPEAIVAQLAQAAGDSLQQELEPRQLEGNVAELEPLYLKYFLPAEVSLPVERRLSKAAWHEIVDNRWPRLKLSALGGRTPMEAAADPQLKVPLAAAVVVLEDFCLGMSFPFDRDGVRQRVGLPPTELFEPAEDQSYRAFSLLELARLSFPSLSDQDLIELLDFVQLCNHPPLRERLVTEILSRPELLKKLDAWNVYRLMARACTQRFAREEALAWITRARQELQSHAESTELFEHRLEVDLEELRARQDDPGDPQIAPLAQRIWSAVQKIPQLRPTIAMVLRRMDLDGPWMTATFDESGTPELVTSGGGLWTPDSDQPATTSGGLWVPE